MNIRKLLVLQIAIVGGIHTAHAQDRGTVGIIVPPAFDAEWQRAVGNTLTGMVQQADRTALQRVPTDGGVEATLQAVESMFAEGADIVMVPNWNPQFSTQAVNGGGMSAAMQAEGLASVTLDLGWGWADRMGGSVDGSDDQSAETGVILDGSQYAFWVADDAQMENAQAIRDAMLGNNDFAALARGTTIISQDIQTPAFVVALPDDGQPAAICNPTGLNVRSNKGTCGPWPPRPVTCRGVILGSEIPSTMPVVQQMLPVDPELFQDLDAYAATARAEIKPIYMFTCNPNW